MGNEYIKKNRRMIIAEKQTLGSNINATAYLIISVWSLTTDFVIESAAQILAYNA
jgi:hypothetical protein